MRLDRNIENGHGNKYALVKNRRLEELRASDPAAFDVSMAALLLLAHNGVLDWGCTPETEFFVIRLRDINAAPALRSYAASSWRRDEEYAREVLELSDRSGRNHPNCKEPD